MGEMDYLIHTDGNGNMVGAGKAGDRDNIEVTGSRNVVLRNVTFDGELVLGDLTQHGRNDESPRAQSKVSQEAGTAPERGAVSLQEVNARIVERWTGELADTVYTFMDQVVSLDGEARFNIGFKGGKFSPLEMRLVVDQLDQSCGVKVQNEFEANSNLLAEEAVRNASKKVSETLQMNIQIEGFHPPGWSESPAERQLIEISVKPT